MSKLVIPYIGSIHSANTFVFSIEGSNGAGKTTLFNRYKAMHKDTECSLCVPEIYQAAKDMKKFMLFESSTLCSALYYLAGAVEMFYRHDDLYLKILFDRSVWSTFAAVYAKDETVLPDLFKCLNAIKNRIFIPDLVVVLDVSFETAKLRSQKKTFGSEFDKEGRVEFQKKKDFFKYLKDAGYQVVFINANDLSIDEVYNVFNAVVTKYYKNMTITSE